VYNQSYNFFKLAKYGRAVGYLLPSAVVGSLSSANTPVNLMLSNPSSSEL
jgi:hypothetical protein